MLDMKVTGFTLLTMSITYTITVGKVEACKDEMLTRLGPVMLTQQY